MIAPQNVVALYVLWGTIALALGAGTYMIANGVVLEPPAFLTQLSNRIERLKMRLQPA